jgi:hypothetical protein
MKSFDLLLVDVHCGCGLQIHKQNELVCSRDDERHTVGRKASTRSAVNLPSVRKDLRRGINEIERLRKRFDVGVRQLGNSSALWQDGNHPRS